MTMIHYPHNMHISYIFRDHHLENLACGCPMLCEYIYKYGCVSIHIIQHELGKLNVIWQRHLLAKKEANPEGVYRQAISIHKQ